MGTNFYMQTKNKQLAEKYSGWDYTLTDEPDWGYQLHLAKTSCGWLPLFQAYRDGIRSVKDMKEAYDTGEFTIYDEYKTIYNWEEFTERVLEFNGGKLGVLEPTKDKPLTEEQKKLFGNFSDTHMPGYTPVSHFPGSKQSYRYSYPDDWISIYKDDEGYEFEEREFS